MQFFTSRSLIKIIFAIILFIGAYVSLPELSFAYPNLAPYDVIIDVGHGGVDGGTSADGILEKDLNLTFGKELYNELKKKSYRVGITRLHDYALSDDSPFHNISRHNRDLRQRKLIADALKPKLFLSLHMNWSENSQRRGPVVIYQASGRSLHLAEIVQQHLNDYFNLHKTPIRGKHYFLMQKLDMPSLIVELGYVSNKEDLQLLTDEKSQRQIVEAIVHAIDEYLFIYPSDMP